jgi:N-acetylneuraminate synthase
MSISKIETIAEIGINHNGDLSIAKQLIDVAIDAGCDYVKFQKMDVDYCYSKEKQATPRKTPFGTTLGEYKKAIQFGKDEFDEIDSYCAGKIKWFGTPKDIPSLHFLMQYDVPFLKISSALITNFDFLRMCCSKQRPIIMSTGMSDWDMIDSAIRILGRTNIHCIMHCHSAYPSPVDEINLNCIRSAGGFKDRYSWAKIGFSNHHHGILALPLAVALGAEIVEFHITLSRASWGSDQAASIEPEGVRKIVKYVKDAEKMLGDGIKRIYESEQSAIEGQRFLK